MKTASNNKKKSLQGMPYQAANPCRDFLEIIYLKILSHQILFRKTLKPAPASSSRHEQRQNPYGKPAAP